MCVVAGMGLRQGDLPELRRERNRSLGRQRPELVPAVVLNMGVGDLNRQHLKASSTAFSSFRRRRLKRLMQSDGPLDHLAAQFDADARSIELYAGFAVAVVIPVPPVIAAVVDVTTNLECWPFSMPMAPFGYHGGPLLTSGFDLKTSMGRSQD